MRTMQRGTVALAALFSASLVMTACTPTTTSIEDSRHTLYSDVAGLAADSEAVVDVVVDRQEIVQEDMPYTLSTVTVIAPLQPTGLAANADAAVTPEQQIVIRQLGSSAEETVPAPLLEVGGRYLLFVTSTQLPGDAASQFYVTGGSAGVVPDGKRQRSSWERRQLRACGRRERRLAAPDPDDRRTRRVAVCASISALDTFAERASRSGRVREQCGPAPLPPIRWQSTPTEGPR
ncbi:hypothetical protein [Microbacterium oxydans]|uniref:Lipoprotein n=1 Tax=Microbacterium oxydans TaxID=82380 RepID=A0A0F0L8T3_9MICO|nr:hypothetical protein [Microbacterium oxydans]KJL29548.1 hypothetical protein RS83_01565 [Microbacterium oxydans]